MNNFFIEFINKLSSYENTYIFVLSIVPYSIFLYYLFKIKELNNIVKIGFSLTILFVAITIIFSICAEIIYGRSLVEVDLFHGLAESFLTLSDFVILLGFLSVLKKLEVKNS
tara:strand:- start:445 stop:780 length:336 start_codon:yes stop_codon:yes gene_type:complete